MNNNKMEVIVMYRSAKSLYGYKILALDGEIGKVHEFFFDDNLWIMKYLVVHTGNWLTGRKVLITPAAISEPDLKSEGIPVALTKEQVKNSPDIDTDKPISIQNELKLTKYYGLRSFWPYMRPFVPLSGAYEIPPNVPVSERGDEPLDFTDEDGDSHLRSTKKVTGYYIQAVDDEIGHADDFIVDDSEWIIRYIVIDTRNFLPGKKVIVSPQWITNISWSESKIYIDIPKDDVKNSPAFDPSAPVNREYEIRLYDYYGRPKYWIKQEED